MDAPFEGNILLTGEGDFSFAFAYALQANDPTRITATCYDNEEAIRKHKGAEKNIKMLRDLGSSVVLGVDATKLHEQREKISDSKQLFSCIIFNFPHIGGKSNIKKNKALLKDFFISAVQVLEDDGIVCVSLCRGQGGTPMDKPRREWQNTWQVVSMATYGGLILKEVKPFSVDDFPQYTSTGFRSRDQWFHTNDALTHIFVKSLPNMRHDLQERITVPGSRKTFCCQSFIARKLKSLNKLRGSGLEKTLWLDSKHPTSAALENVLRNCSAVFPSVRLYLPQKQLDLLQPDNQHLRSDISKYYVMYEDTVNSPNTPEEGVRVLSNEGEKEASGGMFERPKRPVPVDVSSQDTPCSKAVKLMNKHVSSVCSVPDKQGSIFESVTGLPVCIVKQLKALGVDDVVPRHIHLLPSSLVELLPSFHSQMIVDDEQTVILTGVVFERCPVTEYRYPTRRELLIMTRYRNDASFADFSAKVLKCLPESVRNKLRTIECSEADFDPVRADGFVFKSLKCHPEFMIGFDYNPDITDLKAYEPCSSTDAIILDEKPVFNALGFAGLYSPTPYCEDKSLFSFFIWDLDKITLEMNGVKELRLLWSEDQRIHAANPVTNLDIFATGENETEPIRHLGSECQTHCASAREVNLVDLELKHPVASKSEVDETQSNDDRATPDERPGVRPRIVPLCLYPIKHRHDVTFWENRHDDFDEQLFFDSIRSIADDNVKSVTLVNEFDHSEYGHSRCYRNIYQSCDRALSYHMSHDVQNTVRLGVEAQQGVTLR